MYDRESIESSIYQTVGYESGRHLAHVCAILLSDRIVSQNSPFLSF